MGVVLRGVAVLPCVSQGAAPIGPELTVTAADVHVIRELDGIPALTALRSAIEELDGGWAVQGRVPAAVEAAQG